jgi:hypothetical protein
LLYSEGKILCPQYSTNIADAWLVVEKLRKDGKWLDLEVDDVYYDARFYDCMDDFYTDRVTTMSAPYSISLVDKMPERYAYHEAKEQEMREYLGKDVAMMKKTVKGVTSPYTLKQLREDIEKKKEIDLFDIGGCGCFVTDETL